MNPKNNEFKEYVLDQLRHLNVVECKPMFGGFGLYHNGLFFGIVAEGCVYFKTDASTADAYTANPKKLLRSPGRNLGRRRAISRMGPQGRALRVKG